MTNARIRVRRRPDRGHYDRETIDAILDEALTCTVAFVRDGRPVAIPTIHARRDDVLYLHGSPASGFVREASNELPICVSATIVDALVMARSAMHHSMNYRSVVAHGIARPVTDPDEKLLALEAVVEHVVPERWPSLRPMTDDELRQTAIVAMDLDEVSAKVRSGPSVDDDEDYGLPIWAGVVPLRLQALEPQTDAEVPPGVAVPEHVTNYRRP
jgi:nitroimidazol reductase NimA-like FMN-containing flavoprotein (pyridoxamine 5'-phosphate oxidase superfamily)